MYDTVTCSSGLATVEFLSEAATQITCPPQQILALLIFSDMEGLYQPILWGHICMCTKESSFNIFSWQCVHAYCVQ